MSAPHEFCDHCPLCRPACVDAQGRVVPDDAEPMLTINRIWNTQTSYAERKAFIEVTVHNSRATEAVDLAQAFIARVMQALRIERAKKHLPPMWTIYDHPTDYPEGFVVRLWYGTIATEDSSRHATLIEAREQCVVNGASVPLPRQDNDDPCIVETWI